MEWRCAKSSLVENKLKEFVALDEFPKTKLGKDKNPHYAWQANQKSKLAKAFKKCEGEWANTEGVLDLIEILNC